MNTLLSPWADAVIGLGLAFLLIAVAELLARIVYRQVRGGPVESPARKGLHRHGLRYETDFTEAERAVSARLMPAPNQRGGART